MLKPAGFDCFFFFYQIICFIYFFSFTFPSSLWTWQYCCFRLCLLCSVIIHLRRQHNKHPHISQQTLNLWPTENDSILQCVSLISTPVCDVWPSGSDLAAAPSSLGATDGVSTHELGVMTLRGASPKASSINCPHGNGCQPAPHTHTRAHKTHTPTPHHPS